MRSHQFCAEYTYAPKKSFLYNVLLATSFATAICVSRFKVMTTEVLHNSEQNVALQPNVQLRDCQVGPDYKITESAEHREETFDKSTPMAPYRL